MKRVFTFGFAHKCVCGYSLGSHYVEIEGETEDECRDNMHEKFGPQWAFDYADLEAAGVYVEQFNMKRVPEGHGIDCEFYVEPKEGYRIFSVERQMWWGWLGCGYTEHKKAAGIYTKERAEEILREANRYSDTVKETMHRCGV